jgi:hypothetical protein
MVVVPAPTGPSTSRALQALMTGFLETATRTEEALRLLEEKRAIVLGTITTSQG